MYLPLGRLTERKAEEWKDQPTTVYSGELKALCVLSFTLLANCSIFQGADEEGNLILVPRILTVLRGLGFYSLKSLELAEGLVGFKLSGFPQGPIFSFACSSGSCLYSLPWKLRQKRIRATWPLSKCWKLGFMTSWL